MTYAEIDKILQFRVESGWRVVSIGARHDFSMAIFDCQYGDDELCEAWTWFSRGWLRCKAAARCAVDQV